jgi:membrane protein YdbS with pleckstrin-like domain
MVDTELPPIADGIDHQLDRRFIPLQRLRHAILAAMLAATSLVATMVLWIASGQLLSGLVLLPLWFVMNGLAAWWLLRWPDIAFRHSAYRVDAPGIEIRHGVYWRTITTVPRSRVQHTDVSQGPLERRFGLGTLVIHTAGTAHARVTVQGLDHAIARRIRAHLLPRDESDAV